VREISSLGDRIRLGSTSDNWRAHDLGHPGFLDQIRRLIEIHDPDLVIDVGANRGQFAESIRRLGYRGALVSFEPVPHLNRELLGKSATDPDWTIVNAAAGDEAGEFDLGVYSDDSLSSLHTPGEEAKRLFGPYFGGKATVRAKVISIDAWLNEAGRETARRILLKSDTQGHDLAVLKGARSALQRTSAVVTEVSFIRMYDGSPTYREVFEFLEAAGFVAGGLFPISHRAADLALIEMDAIFVRPVK